MKNYIQQKYLNNLNQKDFQILENLFLDTHPLRQPDENFHHGIRRNSEGIGTYGPCSKKYLKNSMGLRDEKIRSVSWVANHSRILSFGDSFTEGGPIQWKKHSLAEFPGP